MRALVLRAWRTTFLRYFASSAAALAVDTGCFFAMIAAGLPAGPASALAYSIGIVAHWLIVSRAVFAVELAEQGPARTRQKMLFVLSALAGLGVTTLVVSAGVALGAGPGISKAVAVALSFTVNWLIRRWVVFRPAPVAVG